MSDLDRKKFRAIRVMCLRCFSAAMVIASLAFTTARAEAAVTVSTVGAKNINLDTRFGGPAQSFTTIDAPVPRITESAAGEIASTIVINAPAGTTFAFSVVAPTFASPVAPSNIVLGAADVFPFFITIPVITPSTTPGTIEIHNIRVQPTGCQPPGNYDIRVTTDAGGAGDLSGATLATVTAVPGPSISRYSLTSDSPQPAGSPITITLSAIDGCGNAIPNATAPSNISISIPVTGLLTWTDGAPFALSNVNAPPNTAAIAAGSQFDASGKGKFQVTNQQPCEEASLVSIIHSNPVTATAQLPILWENPTTDSDNDGVIDCLDICDATPACAAVDASGCPIDSDGDGVLDCDDACPATPVCAAINENGCPIDSDADGVADGCDLCPNTFIGDPVDANGCSTADEDSDGVLNDQDFCKGTEACALASVGADGCPTDADGDGLHDGCDKCPGADDLSDSDGDGIPDCLDACPTDIDSDGDGVQDCLDRCPADPLKVEPGACGCGTIEADADGDGVFDCADACPATPGCATVYSTGCPIDSDADGVADGCDQCPGTFAGDAVDANGCSTDDDDVDGVPNDADACRGTPACATATVDANGCPADADGDGLLDGCDQCAGANDLTDSDGDGTPDCLDACPNDGDTDGDGVQDCQDNCPNDALKRDPGACGCGNADADANGDDIPDCIDLPDPAPQETPNNTGDLGPFLALSPVLPGGIVCGVGLFCPALLIPACMLLYRQSRRNRTGRQR